jgi:hypothetical protein
MTPLRTSGGKEGGDPMETTNGDLNACHQEVDDHVTVLGFCHAELDATVQELVTCTQDLQACRAALP